MDAKTPETNLNNGKMKKWSKWNFIKMIPIVLLLIFAIFLIVQAKGYGDALISERSIEYWTHDNVLKFYHTPLKDGEIVQKFKAGAGDMTEFILEFDDYSAEDTATLFVTLEDKKGNEYYRYECPTMAFGESEPFYLVAVPEKQLKKNGIYEIHINLDNPGSDITVRTIPREKTHKSVKALTVNGTKEKDRVIYFFQSYNEKSSLASVWAFVLICAFVLALAIAFLPSKVPDRIWNYASVLLLAVGGYYILQLLDQGGLDTVIPKYVWLNLLLLIGIFLVLKSILGRFSLYLSGLLVFALGVTDYYVQQFKGEQFLMPDLSAFGVTMSVIGNYTFVITPVVMTAIAIIVCFFLVQLSADLRWGELCSLKKGEKKKSKKWLKVLIQRAAFLLVGFLILFVLYKGKAAKEFSLFSIQKSIANLGYGYSNLCIVRLSHIEKPLSYSGSEIKKIVSEITEPEMTNGTVRPKNIIVIMNESLSDLRIVGNLETNKEFMPYIKSLDKNTVKGQLFVNTFGGGTSITEYEFLTGNTVKFFPAGAKPYSNACKDPEEGVVRTLKAQGYYAVAMHPYGPKNWNRDVVYPELGFDEFIDESSYGDAELLRNYVSDKGDYDFIIDYINNFDRDEDLFIFNVTMQNHGGYDVNNGALDRTITIENMEDAVLAENYLSLVAKSDEAFEYLTDYFSSVDDPTMIVMFGDHQPQLSTEFYDELYGKEKDDRTNEEKNHMYITPYIIWTNYDSDFDEIPVTSANYLGSYMLRCAGLELTDYNKFLLNEQQKVPAIGMCGVSMPDGTFVPYDDLKGNLLTDYKVLQYLRVQDRDEQYYGIFRIEPD